MASHKGISKRELHNLKGGGLVLHVPYQHIGVGGPEVPYFGRVRPIPSGLPPVCHRRSCDLEAPASIDGEEM